MTIKRILFTLIVVLLILPANRSLSQIYNEDFSRQQKDVTFRANRVWMVYGWTFRFIKGKQEKKGKKTSFERFDRSGFRTEEAEYGPDGEALLSCQYMYDDAGFVVKKMGANSDIIYDKWSYVFLNDKTELERRSVYSKAKMEKWLYRIDDQKNFLFESYYDQEGTLTQQVKYEYDRESKLTQKLEMDAYGNVNQKWVLEYDQNGNNIEVQHFKSGRLYKSYQMTYDKKGNMKSKHTFDASGKVEQLTVFVYQFYDGLHAPRSLGSKQ